MRREYETAAGGKGCPLFLFVCPEYPAVPPAGAQLCCAELHVHLIQQPMNAILVIMAIINPAEVQRFRQQLERQTRELRDKEARLSSLRAEIIVSEQEIRKLEQAISPKRNEVQHLEIEVRRAQADESQSRKQLEDLQRKLKELERKS